MQRPPVVPAAYFAETIRAVHHWTDRLFSFRCTRDPAFRFRAGEFVMIGLLVEDRPLVRAYSVASPTWEEELEFLSIKVPNGPLTSRLQHIRPGDLLLVDPFRVWALALPEEAPVLPLSTGPRLAEPPFSRLIG